MVLDLKSTSDHSGLWYCQKCKTWIDVERPKCSFCGAPNPSAAPAQGPAPEDIKLTRSLHDAIERMPYSVKLKVWRWLEDNVL